MIPFLFIVSLLSAFGGAGGWAWFFAVIFGLAWVGKSQEAKNISDASAIPSQDRIADLTKQATEGDPEAAYLLGEYYEQGSVPQDYVKAMSWYKKGADKDHVKAQVCLGLLFSKGLGCPVDKASAFFWYKRAADQGYSYGQLNLAHLHELIGTEADLAEAKRLLGLAALQGFDEAKKELKRLNGGDPLPDSTEEHWVSRLEEICSRYSGSGYYVGELIPLTKLTNAKKHYPLPIDGRVIALLDPTVFGAADDGMLIGETGVSWHNWVTDPKSGTLLWSEFARQNLARDGTKLKMGATHIFDATGNLASNTTLLELLKEIQVTYLAGMEGKQPHGKADPEPKKSKKNKPENQDDSSVPTIVDLNTSSVEDLLGLPGVGVAEAHLLIKRRDSSLFASIEEAIEFLGIKPHHARQWGNLVLVTLTIPADKIPDEPVFAPASQPQPNRSCGRTID
jgi:DNA uptake protein ComE-like DNA-binding protein